MSRTRRTPRIRATPPGQTSATWRATEYRLALNSVTDWLLRARGLTTDRPARARLAATIRAVQKLR